MHKSYFYVLIAIVLLFLPSLVTSQIVAVPGSGCSPLSVQLSGPAGATAVNWNIGSQGSTTLSNPNPIFTSAGNVSISYTAIVNGSPVSYVTQITVSTPPTASFNFQIPASHCAPMTCNFVATGGSPGSTFSWAFGDLTPVVNGNSVSHTYQFSNVFSPVAIVTDAVSGCTAVANSTSGSSIPVSDLPSLVMSSSNGYAGCTPPFVTNVSGLGSTSGSPLGGGLTFNWQFNTGTPGGSSAITPGSVSFGQGQHSIILSATDNNQCTHSITAGVSVINPTISAAVAPTVCIYNWVPVTVNSPQSPVNFAISSIPGVIVNTVIPNQNFTIPQLCMFTSPGPQQIYVSVPATAFCPAFGVLLPVFVEEVLPDFGPVPPLTSCQSPMMAQYVNLTTINSGSSMTFSWFPSWGFNSSWNATPAQIVTTSTTTNATFLLSQGSNNPYTIFNSFMPSITLQAISSNGCIATKQLAFHTLTRPNARYNKNKRMGCAPLVVDFRDTSYVSPAYPITTWTWNSGTTPPIIITNTQIVTFTYTSPGIYVPSLSITTAGGCTSYYEDTVYVSGPPNVNATFPATACAGVPVTISLSGSSSNSPPGILNHWHATSDDGFFSGCITDQNPTYPFTHIGTHTVIASAYESNCGSSDTMTAVIDVFGPLGKFVFTTHCAGDKKIVDFDVHLQDVSTATLSYGDSSPPLIIAGVLAGNFYGQYSHTYAGSGDYIVTLSSEKVSGTCAARSVSSTVHIRQPVARITWGSQQIPALPVALSCTKRPYNFSGLTSTENITTCKSGYKWWFSGPNFELPPLDCKDGIFRSHIHPGPVPVTADFFNLDTFRVVGIYTLSLEVKDINGCSDTTTKIFRIGNAVPVFTFAANPMCLSSGPAQIINGTQASLVVPDVIKSYTWSYGDGGIDTSSNPFFNPTHLYQQIVPPSQTFQVMAIAMNQLNCTDTTIHVLQVNNPATGFNFNNPFPCIKKGLNSDPVLFSASQGYATYMFNAGTPTNNPPWQSTPTFSIVSKTYPLPGVYFPTLTVIDAANCSASNVLTVTAIGQPTAHVMNLGASGFCVPAKIQMKDSSAINVTPLSGYQWNIGTITSPFSPADSLLENIFTLPGTYTVNHIAYAGPSSYCPSSANVIVHVFDTKAKLEIDKRTFCLGDVITVKAKDLNDVYSWKWFFGDLVAQPVIYNTTFANNPLSYKYDTYPPNSTNGKTVITLKAVSDYFEGCTRIDTVSVQVIRIDADFVETQNNYRHCLTKTADNFSNTTLNPLNLNYNFNWNFSNGTVGTGSLIANEFNDPGVYPVILNVKDAKYSCTAISVKNMTILALPKGEISISDSLVCPKDSFIIFTKGIPVIPGLLIGYLAPLSNSVISLPPQNTYSVALTTSISTSYTFSVLDSNRCESPPVYIQIKVPAPAPEVHTATTIVIGQTVALSAQAPGEFTYYWTPEHNNLSDTIGPISVSNSTQNITYSVLVVDQPKQCWVVQSTFSVIVLPITSIDVPSAFTPNGDGLNDFIFPDGWGIRKLIYFRVYNRWGQLLFETNEYKHGWNGMYEGIPQNMETYVYQAEVETYLDSEPKIQKSGTFKLIR